MVIYNLRISNFIHQQNIFNYKWLGGLFKIQIFHSCIRAHTAYRDHWFPWNSSFNLNTNFLSGLHIQHKISKPDNKTNCRYHKNHLNQSWFETSHISQSQSHSNSDSQTHFIKSSQLVFLPARLFFYQLHSTTARRGDTPKRRSGCEAQTSIDEVRNGLIRWFKCVDVDVKSDVSEFSVDKIITLNRYL